MPPPPDPARVSRRQLQLAAATLVGVYLVVFGPSVLGALRVLAGGSTPIAGTGGWDRLAAVEWDLFGVAVVWVVVLRWLPRHAPGARIPTRPGRGTAGGAAAFVAVVLVSIWLGDRVVDVLGLPRAAARPDGGTGEFVLNVLSGAAAGITEEIVLVALAAAVVTHGLAHRPRLVLPVTLALLVVLRWLPHAYYLGDSVFVLLWAPGAYLVYRLAGTVAPLILGHAAYDAVALAGHAYPALGRVVDAALWASAVVGGLWLVRRGVGKVRRGPKVPVFG